MKRNILNYLIIVIMGSFLFSACGKSSSGDTPAATPTNPSTPVTAATASIQNFAFSPAIIYLKTGGTVTWTNMDSAPHTVTDLGGTFDSKSLATNQTFLYKFPTAGTYNYHCTIHSMMANASVVVTN